MYKKSVMLVQSCCFAYQTYCFFDVLVAVAVTVAVVVAKAPYSDSFHVGCKPDVVR